MKIYEFQFNPGEKDDLIFDSFCYEPGNIYERKLGGILMLGELKRALPHNFRLLEKIALSVKKEFYSKVQRTPEAALKESLKRINEMLASELAKENSDWLGNLNFAIISLNNLDLHFAKVGDIKMFLLRSSHVIDIGQKLDGAEIEPYPLKVFGNIVSGKLAENDVLAMIGEEIFPATKNIITDIANLSAQKAPKKNNGQTVSLTENELKELIKPKQDGFGLLSGAMVVTQIVKSPAGKHPKIIFQKEAEKFSATQTLSKTLSGAKKTLALPLKAAKLAGSIRPKIRLPIFKKPTDLNSVLEEKTGAKIVAQKEPVKVDVQIEKPKEETEIPKKKISVKLRVKLPVPRLPHFGFLNDLPFKIGYLLGTIRRFRQRNKRNVLLLFILVAILLIGFLIFNLK